MQLTREQIAALIPHGASMSMFDEVVSWDANSILCRSFYTDSSQNPLMSDELLASVLLIEFGAQAAAIHAALLQSSLGARGPAYIGAVKQVALHKSCVNTQAAVDVEANCLLNNANGAIYEVNASQLGERIMSGKLILNQPPMS
jgi:predicted hotdog family 3-hydroxylacyl-ACP dehydratase